MTSNDNDFSDFSEWIDRNEHAVASTPKVPGVYAFRLKNKKIGRLKGESDLLYVGSTKNIQDRLNGYRTPAPEPYIDVNRVHREVGPVEVAWKDLKNKAEPRLEERRLLLKYLKDHFEPPPLNSQLPTGLWGARPSNPPNTEPTKQGL